MAVVARALPLGAGSGTDHRPPTTDQQAAAAFAAAVPPTWTLVWKESYGPEQGLPFSRMSGAALHQAHLAPGDLGAVKSQVETGLVPAGFELDRWWDDNGPDDLAVDEAMTAVGGERSVYISVAQQVSGVSPARAGSLQVS